MTTLRRRRHVRLSLALPWVLGWSGCVLTGQATGEHPAWRRVVATPEQFGLHGTRVHFLSRDSTPLSAVWIESEGSPRGTVVLAAGQAANGSFMLGRAAFLVRAGWNACVVDLRDTGESGGTYVTPGYGEADDVLAAVAFVHGRTPPLPVVILGHSAGAVAVLHAAASPGIEAAIAESPFSSYRGMLARAAVYVRRDSTASMGMRLGLRLAQLPGMMALSEWAFRLRTGVSISPDLADARVAVQRLGQHPVLFIAGELDPIAPPSDVELLYRSTPGSGNQLVVVPNASHNVFGSAPDAYARAVLGFLDAATAHLSNQTR